MKIHRWDHTCNILLEKSWLSAMLPSLWRLCAIMPGSSLESDMELDEVGLLPPATKLSIVADRLYSSSRAFWRLRRIKNQTPAAIAIMATTPTTTPAAMPAVLVPPSSSSLSPSDGALDCVTMTVWPAWLVVVGASESEELLPPLPPSFSMSSSFSSPVRYSENALSPPPKNHRLLLDDTTDSTLV